MGRIDHDVVDQSDHAGAPLFKGHRPPRVRCDAGRAMPSALSSEMVQNHRCDVLLQLLGSYQVAAASRAAGISGTAVEAAQTVFIGVNPARAGAGQQWSTAALTHKKPAQQIVA